MGNNHIIELNGKQYDAVSGTLLNKPAIPQAKRIKVNVVNQIPQTTTHTKHKTSVPSQNPTHHAKPAKRVQGQSVVRHKPERSQTLMRRAVKKPSPHQKAIHHVQTPASSSLAQYMDQAVAKHSAIDEKRLIRAKQARKNSTISHFGAHTVPSIVTRLLPLAVKPAPLQTHHKKAKPSALPHTGSTIQQLLAHGVARAQSHKTDAKQTSRSDSYPTPKLNIKSEAVKFIAIGVSLFVLALIGLQNIPTIDVKVASLRAGVHAVMPSYQPAGFEFKGPVEYADGIVKISFRSTTDQRSFSLIQQNSQWDTQTLKDSLVSTSISNNRTLQVGGRTIYITTDGNATWVNNGVWYQILGNPQLSTSQLVNLVSST